MNNIDNVLITQVDYIKCLLEEQRLGEALNCIHNISKDLEQYCDKLAQQLSSTDLELSKEQLKIKKGNYIYIQNVWLKIIDKSSTHIELGISNGISVLKTLKKSKIKVNDTSHV